MYRYDLINLTNSKLEPRHLIVRCWSAVVNGVLAAPLMAVMMGDLLSEPAARPASVKRSTAASTRN